MQRLLTFSPCILDSVEYLHCKKVIMVPMPPTHHHYLPLVGGAHVVAPGAQHARQGLEYSIMIEKSIRTGASIIVSSSYECVRVIVLYHAVESYLIRKVRSWSPASPTRGEYL